MSCGERNTVSKFGSRCRNAASAHIAEIGFRFVHTNASTACATASMPVTAVTDRGCESVTSGSRMATRNAAFLSPHAIFRCDRSSVMSA